jgi:glycosyltransferase involved in cell wall biosynthesis
MGRSWECSFTKTALIAFQLHRLRSSGWLDTIAQWIAVSEFMRMKFIEAGIPETKITTLRHCWTSRSDGTNPVDGKYYLFLGRLVPEKGVGTLLEAWRKLENRMGNDCPRLIIAGTGPEEAKVIASANASRRVEFAGFVSGEAKQTLLRNCRAVIAPSIWWEPLGLIVYEAYDYGKPVIAARSGGLVETVREGDGGLLHEPGNCDSLVEAVMKLEKLDPDERVGMGRAGRNWLVEHASPEAWKAGFTKIIEKASNV